VRGRAGVAQLSLFALFDAQPDGAPIEAPTFDPPRRSPRREPPPAETPRRPPPESTAPPVDAREDARASREDAPAERDAAAGPEALLRALWRRSAPGWSAAWGVPDLTDLVRVELSTRMRSSLGGFWPTEKLIRITDVLFEAPPHLLEEVLCHEAAHAAAHLLHGERVRSHGREWKELMRKAGLAPRVRIPTRELGGAAQRAARKRWLWEHRCPVCRAHRLAGRPVRQWRCGPCRAAGRHGRLVITRRPASVVRPS
jgi:predicted SprT family Zn-dependent metalloprotease